MAVTENSISASLKKIDFKLFKKHIDDTGIKDSIFIELDKEDEPYQKLSYFFCSDAKHVNKRSDLVVYHEKEEYLGVLICDLKSSAGGCVDERATFQYMNSRKFLDYINGLASEYYEKNKRVEIFYISFFPMLPMSVSSNLGEHELEPLHTYEHGINSYEVNINDKGEALVIWEEVLARLP
ncbi:hypothetical protein [Vibrio sp. Vb339]|uniref:hypothetical protein n=1 Tax=Vibrio sp. Vb339 TaxID=1192013 RepID=UPI001556BE76|nr:hypothetical protein [Vibrio sp. Vb339]